jgi:hypothetical protein
LEPRSHEEHEAQLVIASRSPRLIVQFSFFALVSATAIPSARLVLSVASWFALHLVFDSCSSAATPSAPALAQRR